MVPLGEDLLCRLKDDTLGPSSLSKRLKDKRGDVLMSSVSDDQPVELSVELGPNRLAGL